MIVFLFGIHFIIDYSDERKLSVKFFGFIFRIPHSKGSALTIMSSDSSQSFWTAKRVVSTFIVFSFIAVIGFSSCNSDEPTYNSNAANANSSSATTTTRPNLPPPPLTTKNLTPVPDEVLEANITAVNGKTFKLSDYKDKVLLVNLWATWCKPCRSETPELVKISKEFKDKGVEVIGLDIDPIQDDEEKVVAFAEEFNIPYTVAIIQPSLKEALSGGGSMDIPQNLIITRDRKLLARLAGYSPQRAAQIRQHLRAALNMKE
jgi:thiol-disulfide isomerase/thioredoxin